MFDAIKLIEELRSAMRSLEHAQRMNNILLATMIHAVAEDPKPTVAKLLDNASALARKN